VDKTPRHYESARWPFGLNRAIAADYIGFSAGHFDKMVADGRMPAPRREGSRLVWLRDELEAALRALPSEGDDDSRNDWENAA
jgi:predicted DNA-binding transcriptional regulator AlpA